MGLTIKEIEEKFTKIQNPMMTLFKQLQKMNVKVFRILVTKDGIRHQEKQKLKHEKFLQMTGL